jgi:hypothetical protein
MLAELMAPALSKLNQNPSKVRIRGQQIGALRLEIPVPIKMPRRIAATAVRSRI